MLLQTVGKTSHKANIELTAKRTHYLHLNMVDTLVASGIETPDASRKSLNQKLIRHCRA